MKQDIEKKKINVFWRINYNHRKSENKSTCKKLVSFPFKAKQRAREKEDILVLYLSNITTPKYYSWTWSEADELAIGSYSEMWEPDRHLVRQTLVNKDSSGSVHLLPVLTEWLTSATTSVRTQARWTHKSSITPGLHHSLTWTCVSALVRQSTEHLDAVLCMSHLSWEPSL